MVDFGFFVKFDAHMRQNRRNFRVFSEYGRQAAFPYGLRVSAEHASRLW